MTDDEDDPFDRLGDVDREGDPFERLEGPDDEADEHSEPEPNGPATDERDESDPEVGERSEHPENDPLGELGNRTPATEPSDGETAASTDAVSTDDDPFADLDERGGDPFTGGGSSFEQVDVETVDADEIWDEITEEGEDEPPVPDEDRYAEVSKHAYCQQCEYFSEPPESHCTHETAEIVEYLDMDRVRVRDCPIVAKRKELE